MSPVLLSGKSKNDDIFNIVNYALLLIILLTVLYPLYFIVIASFSDPGSVVNGKVVFLPKGFNFEAYKMVFRDASILQSLRNTVFYTVLGTAINILLTVFAAYPLSRKDLKGRNFFTIILAITMFFSGGLIPTYLLVNDLHMINTIWALVIPNAVSVWNIIITRTYMETGIPYELQEAAFVDGCRNIRLLFTIIIPLSAPVLAVMVLFYGVAHWNSFFNALIYLNDKELYPLQLVLRAILIQNKGSENMLVDADSVVDRMMLAETIKYALIIVASLPIICVYPLLQKYFVKGIMIGAIKG